MSEKNISIETRTKVLKLRGNGGGAEDRLLTRPYHGRQLQLDQNVRKVFNICKQLKKETFAFAKSKDEKYQKSCSIILSNQKSCWVFQHQWPDCQS